MTSDGKQPLGGPPEDSPSRANEETEPMLALVYDELRALAGRLMGSERADHTLQPTALVHEAWLRIAGAGRSVWTDEAHFKATSVRVMRNVLVDHARRKRAEKRGGDRHEVTLSAAELVDGGERLIDALVLDSALRRLEALNERHARVVELRFLGGLTIEETARVLEIDPSTVKADWTLARAFLADALSAETD